MSKLALMALTVLLALPGAVQAQDSTKKEKPKRNPNVISFAEIDEIRSEVSNAYDVVRRLRPQFLRSRGQASMDRGVPYAKVILDGMPRGDLSTLRQIAVLNIEEIRYLRASDATTQYGTGYDGGAIVIKTRR